MSKEAKIVPLSELMGDNIGETDYVEEILNRINEMR